MDEVIYDYKIDYDKAYAEAQKLAQKIISTHPEIEYTVYIWEGDGAYIVLYGDDDEIAMNIAEPLVDKRVELLLAGAPIYITYGGPNRKHATNS